MTAFDNENFDLREWQTQQMREAVSIELGDVETTDLVTTKQIADLWETSSQTINRWTSTPVCGFPQPVVDMGIRLYYKPHLYEWLKLLGKSLKSNTPISQQ